MSLISLLAVNLGVLLAFMLVGWLISLRLNDVSVVDAFWGSGFVLVAGVTLALAPALDWRAWLMAALVALWGIRLTAYIVARSYRHWGVREDKRYAAMRANRGSAFRYQSLYLIFGLQAIILWVIAWPVQTAIHEVRPGFGLLDGLGIALWLVGWLFETVADAQMAAFKADPNNRGRVMDRGLWRYSRHPNYFGETLVWWGIGLIALPGAPWTLVAPILITFLLVRVSGVTMLERVVLEERPGFAAYRARTNAFIPWFPKSSAPSTSSENP
jgi:steroid 5-alpha reductase family enzyme